MKLNDMHYVGDETGDPIVPLDSNVFHDDQGMLLYRSKEAAEGAAKHQEENYGGGEMTCHAFPLTRILEPNSKPEKVENGRLLAAVESALKISSLWRPTGGCDDKERESEYQALVLMHDRFLRVVQEAKDPS